MIADADLPLITNVLDVIVDHAHLPNPDGIVTTVEAMTDPERVTALCFALGLAGGLVVEQAWTRGTSVAQVARELRHHAATTR